jgi:DNA polymerase-3 subunit epsilon
MDRLWDWLHLPGNAYTNLAERGKQGGVRPKPAATGPLRGHWIALVGTTVDSAIAHELAAARAKIMASVGKSTTLLVINADEPFDYGIKRSASYRKAEDMMAQGTRLQIISVQQVRAMIRSG